MAETAKKFLDYEGLQYLINKLVAGEVKGKGLSSNDFTDALLAKLNSTATSDNLSGLQTRLAAIEAHFGTDSDKVINKFQEIVAFLAGIESTETLDGLLSDVATQISGKVDKVSGKGLSTNDYTTAEKNKLSGIEAGAQKNAVASVAGKTGVVALVKGDVGLGNVDNTSDANKPISTATQAALDLKADAADIPTALKNPSAITVTLNGGTTEGTNKFTYDGSAAKTVNITASGVGAMTTSQIKSATFAAGKFSAKTYTPTAAATINVPTNTSHLTNDSKFITLADIEAVTSTEIDALISA